MSGGLTQAILHSLYSLFGPSAPAGRLRGTAQIEAIERQRTEASGKEIYGSNEDLAQTMGHYFGDDPVYCSRDGWRIRGTALYITGEG